MGVTTISDFLFGLKRVDKECFSLFEPFYTERSKHYIYPLFYQSVIQMIAANGFFYKFFRRNGNSTLCVFKRSAIMGNYAVMLHFAPISLQGDRNEEMQLMQEARRLGISIKLCREDISRYNIPQRLLEPIKGNVEYIYNANEIQAMKGGANKNFRKNVHKITKHPDYRHVLVATSDIDNLVAKWDDRNHKTRGKGQQTSQLSDWRNIKRTNSDKVHIHSIYVGNTLECFSVIEELCPKHWILVMGMRNYDSKFNEINTAMHWLDCDIAHDENLMAVYANMGASLGISGLSAVKEKLHPCAKLQIYRLPAASQLDKNKAKELFR